MKWAAAALLGKRAEPARRGASALIGSGRDAADVPITMSFGWSVSDRYRPRTFWRAASYVAFQLHTSECHSLWDGNDS